METIVLDLIIVLLVLGSYPTYEEWKQRYGIGDTNMNFVLILPMRNGNFVKASVHQL